MKKLLIMVVCLLSLLHLNAQNWNITNYVDCFGDEIAIQYTRTTAQGEFFGGSETNTNTLLVGVCVDKRRIKFNFYEYGTTKASFTPEISSINVVTETNETFNIKCYQNGTGVHVTKQNYNKLQNLFIKFNALKCTYNEKTSCNKNTYVFNVDVSKFNKSFKTLK